MGGLKKLCPFKRTRKSLVSTLQKTSQILYANPSPTELHHLTSTTLPTLLTQTETLLSDGEFEENITDTALPLCFRSRCKQILAELAWTQTVLSANPNPAAVAGYAGAVLEMVALQVGRLVVDGQSDGDGFADEMERLVHEFEDGVKGRERMGDDGEEERERQVEMVWERLNMAYEGCGCFQCAWRFVESDSRVYLFEEDEYMDEVCFVICLCCLSN